MNTVIELPQEANPLTPEILFKTLESAASSYQFQIQTAAQQLQKWETEKGYYSLLQVRCSLMFPCYLRLTYIVLRKSLLTEAFH